MSDRPEMAERSSGERMMSLAHTPVAESLEEMIPEELRTLSDFIIQRAYRSIGDWAKNPVVVKIALQRSIEWVQTEIGFQVHMDEFRSQGMRANWGTHPAPTSSTGEPGFEPTLS